MATTLLDGHRTWSMTRDDDGYRTYKIIYRVKGAHTDGPANALRTPGLPLPGSLWVIDADIDLWAWCRPAAQVTPVIEDEPNKYWDVELTFSNKPPPLSRTRCQDVEIEDPLLEPARISGSFLTVQEEATHHLSGAPIINSAFQPIKGPPVEFDVSYPTITIEQNVAVLGLGLLASYVNCVNGAPLWGLPARTIRLSNISWERRFYGACYLYYNRSLEFQVNYRTFDRVIPDEGSKALNGYWDETTRNWILRNINGVAPDPTNPNHFIKLKDFNDESITMPLNGTGEPVDQKLGGYITDISNDFAVTRIVTVDSAHGLNTGDRVAINNVAGAVEVNGEWTITVLSSTTFSLDGSAGTGFEHNPFVAGQGTWHSLDRQGFITVQRYPGVNFLTLGIPISF